MRGGLKKGRVVAKEEDMELIKSPGKAITIHVESVVELDTKKKTHAMFSLLYVCVCVSTHSTAIATCVLF